MSAQILDFNEAKKRRHREPMKARYAAMLMAEMSLADEAEAFVAAKVPESSPPTCAPCVAYSASRIPSRRSCSSQCAARVHGVGLPPHGRARRAGCRAREHQGPPAHAAPCVRIQAGQRRCRYAHTSSLSGPQKHRAHGEVHRAFRDPLQGAVEGLSRCNTSTGGSIRFRYCPAAKNTSTTSPGPLDSGLFCRKAPPVGTPARRSRSPLVVHLLEQRGVRARAEKIDALSLSRLSWETDGVELICLCYVAHATHALHYSPNSAAASRSAGSSRVAWKCRTV
jgi:hypothetical protein